MCTPEDVANCEAAGGCPMHGTGKGSCPPGMIVIGKQNSKENPCKTCGSTTVCDCPLDMIKGKISTADFNCLDCGFGCYIPWNYCPKCGKKLGEKKAMEAIKEWRKTRAQKSHGNSENAEQPVS